MHVLDTERLLAVQLREHHVDLSSAWLEELYVEPAYRAAGMGTAFLQQVLDECAARGCAALDLEIDVDHERVGSLYLRNGFEELPRGRLIRRLVLRTGTGR